MTSRTLGAQILHFLKSPYIRVILVFPVSTIKSFIAVLKRPDCLMFWRAVNKVPALWWTAMPERVLAGRSSCDHCALSL